MGKGIGINELIGHDFQEYDFQEPWLSLMGKPERNFKMLIIGRPKQGKTDFTVKLSKYLTRFGKVYYNSAEEGKSSTLKKAFVRNNMEEVAGKLIIGNRETYEEMRGRLSAKGSPRFVILDSHDYMELTERQYKELVKLFPRKAIIIICWGSKKGIPESSAAQAISFMVDIIIVVEGLQAFPTSRFEGNKPWKFGTQSHNPGHQLSLL